LHLHFIKTQAGKQVAAHGTHSLTYSLGSAQPQPRREPLSEYVVPATTADGDDDDDDEDEDEDESENYG